MENISLLWKESLNGNTTSLRKLIDAFFTPLYNYGFGFTRDAELVKDTIQEVFIVIWRSRANLSTDVNVRAYLLSSFRRALHRKIKPLLKVVPLSNYSGIDRFLVDVQVDEGYIQKQRTHQLANEIAALLNRLPARQKEVIYLKFFMQLTRDEISSALSIAPQTVSNIIQMALKNLRAACPETLRQSV